MIRPRARVLQSVASSAKSLEEKHVRARPSQGGSHGDRTGCGGGSSSTRRPSRLGDTCAVWAGLLRESCGAWTERPTWPPCPLPGRPAGPPLGDGWSGLGPEPPCFFLKRLSTKTFKTIKRGPTCVYDRDTDTRLEREVLPQPLRSWGPCQGLAPRGEVRALAGRPPWLLRPIRSVKVPMCTRSCVLTHSSLSASGSGGKL